MAWVNTRWPGSVSSPQFFDPGIGPPNPALISQWPQPGTKRTENRRRWITEPLRRPYPLRCLFECEYSSVDPALSGGDYEFKEFGWSDYSYIEQGFLISDTQPSGFGTRARHAMYVGNVVEDSATATLAQYLFLQTPGDPERRAVLDPKVDVVYNQIGGVAIWTPPPPTGCIVRSQEILNVDMSVNGAILTNADGDRPAAFDKYHPSLGRASQHALGGCRFLATDDGTLFHDIFLQKRAQHDLFLEVLAPDQWRWVVLVHWIYLTTFPGSSVVARFHGPLFDPALPAPDTIPFTAVFDSLNDFGAGASDIDYSSASVDVTAPVFPGLDQWPWKRVTCTPFSECYPTATFLNLEGAEVASLNGAFLKMVPSQSIASDPDLQFVSPIVAPFYENGGVWLSTDPLDDFRKIIVPPGWNYVKIHGQITTGNQRQNSLAFRPFLNGSGFPGIPIVADRHTNVGGQDASLTLTTGGWRPVQEGDVITFRAVQNGGVTSSSANNSWVQVEAAV